MVEYYDDRRKALIKITYGKKKPNSAKKRQYKNSKLNQFGSAQRDALNKMVFIRSMATKDPQFAPLDMQDRIISARKEQLELQKQIAGLTLAIQALNRNDDKEFAKFNCSLHLKVHFWSFKLKCSASQEGSCL